MAMASPLMALTTADSVLRWASRAVSQLQNRGLAIHGEDLAKQLQMKLRGLVLTTAFSGIGGAEESLRHLILALRKAGYDDDEMQVSVAEAIDTDSSARSVLAQHADEVRPKHIFENVLSLVPQPLLSSIMALRDEPQPAGADAMDVQEGGFIQQVGRRINNLISGT